MLLLTVKEASELIAKDWPPVVEMSEIWRNSLDDYWHRSYDLCPVCRTVPCDYKE